MRTIILNTSIVTAYGAYRYVQASLEEVQALLVATEDTGIESVIKARRKS